MNRKLLCFKVQLFLNSIIVFVLVCVCQCECAGMVVNVYEWVNVQLVGHKQSFYVFKMWLNVTKEFIEN